MWIFFLQTKYEATGTFFTFMHMVERNFDIEIRSVQSDGGKKFQFLSFTLHSIVINHRKTCLHTFEQNGVMETKNKRVVERGLAMLIHKS